MILICIASLNRQAGYATDVACMMHQLVGFFGAEVFRMFRKFAP